MAFRIGPGSIVILYGENGGVQRLQESGAVTIQPR
jgi:hypothetical protein